LSGRGPKKGRNSFEGFDTTRIYALLDKYVNAEKRTKIPKAFINYSNRRTRVFDKFCILPRVLALNEYFLDPGYMISAFHTIQINPGEKAQELHYGKTSSNNKCSEILTIRGR
jgi:hypothetical protein